MLKSLTGLALWVILLLVLVLVKANRTPRAWLVLLPLGAVFIVWSMVKGLLSVPSEVSAVFDQLLATLTIGFSVLLLSGHKIGNRNRAATFFLALLIMALLSVAGGISFGGSFSLEVVIYVILSFVMAVMILLAFVFAGLSCRKKFSCPRFTVWLGVWTVVQIEVVMLVYYLIAMIAMSTKGGYFPMGKLMFLLTFLLSGLVMGGILFAILLPFMILVAKSEFFRDRLFACMRLRSMTPVAELAEDEVESEVAGIEMDTDTDVDMGPADDIQPPDQEELD